MTDLLAVAKDMLALRRRRDALLGSGLFGEPAWDMLLELYLATGESRPFTISNLGTSAGVPSTTALRWTGLLLDSGLIERNPDRRDGRCVLVSLTARGHDVMDGLLGSFGNERVGFARSPSAAIDMWTVARPI
jgi:DNA-binding MarR family transcriptional regulator